MSIYVLVAIIRKPNPTDSQPNSIRETPIGQALQISDYDSNLSDSGNQLILFDFSPDSLVKRHLFCAYLLSFLAAYKQTNAPLPRA